jgi:DNA-binding Lrp family transcriptional regulator
VAAYIVLERTQDLALREQLGAALNRIPEVETMAWVAGEFDALLLVRARDTHHLDEVISRIHAAGGGVGRSPTLVALSVPVKKPGPSFEEISPFD